jgi:lipopolysaccharide export system protein LptA
MSWQKKARVAIAVFVVVFATMVFLAMRQRAAAPAPAASPRQEDDTTREIRGPSSFQKIDRAGRLTLLKSEGQKAYADGRNVLVRPVLTLPDRGGRTLEISAVEADVLAPDKGQHDISTAVFRGDVKLKTDNGAEVRSAEAKYDAASGMVTVPGPVEFSRGRMKGKGVGATYDRGKDVLWLLDQARVFVEPDSSGGGTMEATSGAAGFARAENYVRLTRNAHIVSENRTIDADEATAILQPDGQTLRQLQLRGHSRITGTGGGAQSMSATDIDLTYADDGRTLQAAKLMENATVDLPGEAGASGRRIAGRTIDMTMSPDGATLTGLTAASSVQVDLPAEGNTPAKRIRSQTLQASGAPGAGLQNAAFDGAVEYTETRTGNGATANRTATAMRLTVTTRPGLGAIERADFRGNVRINDGASQAQAPRALYDVARDQFDLSPSVGDPGPTPKVTDEQLVVEARGIQFSPSTRRMKADTDVRSVLQGRRPEKPGGKVASSQTRMPAMLKEDRPVNVTASKLDYDGTVATYTGAARLWQDQSRIDAGTIVLDDKTGNLTARGSVRSTMMLEDTDPKTKQRTVSRTMASGETLVYDEAKRLATYTSGADRRAQMSGPQGDVTADRVDLYLKPGGSELERAEAEGSVTVKESTRTATGATLVYTTSDEKYVMNGTPVEIVYKEQDACKKTTGTVLTFERSVDTFQVDGNGLYPQTTVPVACTALERRD